MSCVGSNMVLALEVLGSALLLAVAVVALSVAVGLYANRIVSRIAEKRGKRRDDHGSTSPPAE